MLTQAPSTRSTASVLDGFPIECCLNSRPGERDHPQARQRHSQRAARSAPRRRARKGQLVDRGGPREVAVPRNGGGGDKLAQVRPSFTSKSPGLETPREARTIAMPSRSSCASAEKSPSVPPASADPLTVTWPAVSWSLVRFSSSLDATHARLLPDAWGQAGIPDALLVQSSRRPCWSRASCSPSRHGA